MWSQYSDSQINIAEAVLMFLTVNWVAGDRVSGVVCFAPVHHCKYIGLGQWKLSALCDCVCVCVHVRTFKFVLHRVELEPVPCVFYLHLNEAKVIYPSTAVRLYLSLPHSLSVSQSVKQTLISLPGKVTHSVVQLFQSLSSRFHLYQGKALTPHTAAISHPSAREPHFHSIKSSVCLCV